MVTAKCKVLIVIVKAIFDQSGDFFRYNFERIILNDFQRLFLQQQQMFLHFDEPVDVLKVS